MKRIIAAYLLFSFLSGCHQTDSQKLTIATAANLQFAMKEISKTFTEETGIACEIITGSSGKLTAQILEGAPYDIFLSANMKYPNELHRQGLTTKPPEIFAYGKLVLWSLRNSLQPSIGLLTDSEISHIAVANPKTAPCGTAAIEVLEKQNMLKIVEPKLVFGESIAQTNQFITSQAAEIGFTAKSVVVSPAMKGKGSWKEIDQDDYTPIAQCVVLLKNQKVESKHAQDFYKFLFSNKGREILVAFGYELL